MKTKNDDPQHELANVDMRSTQAQYTEPVHKVITQGQFTKPVHRASTQSQNGNSVKSV